MLVTLVGSGPDAVRTAEVVAPFVTECNTIGARRIAVILAGDDDLAGHFFPDYAQLLEGVDGDLEAVPLTSDLRAGFPGCYDAFVVGGGPTPLYHDLLAGAAAELEHLVRSGAPWLGFSAGAMVSARDAIVGGHRVDGSSLCPVEWSEGLDQIDVRPGIGLVPWAVDTHAAQAGTLGRAVEAVVRRLAPGAVALDEDTALIIDDTDEPVTIGSGRSWWVTPCGQPDRSGRVAVRVEPHAPLR